MKLSLITFALLLGVACSVIVQSNNATDNHIMPTKKCEVITLSAEPTKNAEADLIRRYNPALSESDANDLFKHIQKTISKYHNDPRYQRGAVGHINARLFLALILKESGFKWSAISNHGAIGLCQVMPLHIPDLERAGLGTDLLDAKQNISAGVHILMGYARRVSSVDRALAHYNAGPAREKAGRGYARAVLKLYGEIGG